MNKRTKWTAISQSEKHFIASRDNYKCIMCNGTYMLQYAHFISRAYGGVGDRRNVVLLCQGCHFQTDQTPKRKTYLKIIENYLKSVNEHWNKEELIYKKGE